MAGRPALIASGRPSPRNYAANTFAFRANSHFLYLFGIPLRGAYALKTESDWAVYAPEPNPADALWHGAEPTAAELSERLGCPVHDLEALPAALASLPQMAGTVGAADHATRAEQQRLLSRPLAAGKFGPDDLPLADALVAERLVHDEGAIAELRRAARATAAAHAAGMAATRPGIREAVVRAAMEAELIARNMTVAYGSIVTIHGEVLHNEAYHHTLAAGDLLLADVGAETEGGFAGDVTRTWPVSGRYSPTQRDLYGLVLRVQKGVVAAVGPGVRYKDLHMKALVDLAEGLVDLGILRGEASSLVESGAASLFFPHGVGHLLGLDVHDMEDLGDRAGYAVGRQRSANFKLRTLRLDRDLVPGMAVTIEPGFYQVPAILKHPELGQDPALRDQVDWARLSAFSDVRGIRIEDDVLVTDHGHEVLTAPIPKEIHDVEAAVGTAGRARTLSQL